MPKGVPNTAAMYGIYLRSWGFEVSITREGIRHTRQFGKASYGSLEQALLQAQDWRDALVRSMPPIARRERAKKIRANNATGVPGVFLQLSNNGKALAWAARTSIGQDEMLRVSFTHNLWGDAAQELAIQERNRQLDHMHGLARLHPAEETIRTGAPTDPDAVRSSKRSRSEVLRKSNTSGVSGVHFKAPRPDHPGYWLAITYTAGKGSVSKAFSIKKHGDETARRMAISEREKQLAQKSGDVDSSDSRPQ